MLIFYTNFAVPNTASGCARGPFFFIRPEYKDDIGLLEHEKIHVGQWYRTLGLRSFLYLFSKKYRLESEVEAYRKQLEHSPNDIDRFSEFIANDYDLDISTEDAKKLLS